MKFLETKLFAFTLFLMIPIVLYFDEYFLGNYLNQIMLFSVPLLWPGLAHGSLDIEIAKQKKIITTRLEMIFFLLIYISIPTVFFLSWINFPNYIFILFLLLSILHFGVSDCINKNKFRTIEVLIRGIMVISLPFKFHLERSIEIFSFFFIKSDFLLKLSFYINYFYIFLIILFFIWFIQNCRLFNQSKEPKVILIEFILLFFCFWFFEPLFSFFIYFCFLHSFRHLIDEKNNLKLNNSKLFLKTLPMTLITLIFFALLVPFLNNQPNISEINYIIVGLSSLTISHILLVNFTKNN